MGWIRFRLFCGSMPHHHDVYAPFTVGLAGTIVEASTRVTCPAQVVLAYASHEGAGSCATAAEARRARTNANGPIIANLTKLERPSEGFWCFAETCKRPCAATGW